MQAMKSIVSIFFATFALSTCLASSLAFAFFTPVRYGSRPSVSVGYLPDNECEEHFTIDTTFAADKHKSSGTTLDVAPEVLNPFSMLREKAALSRVMTIQSNASKMSTFTTVLTPKKPNLANWKYHDNDNHSHPLNPKLFYTGTVKFLSAENEKSQFKMLRQRSALLSLMKSEVFRSSLIQETDAIATVISASSEGAVTNYNDDHSHKIDTRFMYTGSVGLLNRRA
ncbi:hypothetical protein ACHAXS_012636 [Conticribra weissflogii]